MLSFITDWDYAVLEKMGGIRNDVLSYILSVFSYMCDLGIFWIAVCVILLINPKTRKIGIYAACALVLQLILGEGIIKHLVRRERPYIQYPDIDTFIRHPSGYSFPSGHSAASAAASLSIFLQNKKLGAPMLVIALLVMFSRLYFQVHFVSDVVCGCLLGAAVSVFIYLLLRHIEKKRRFESAQTKE